MIYIYYGYIYIIYILIYDDVFWVSFHFFSPRWPYKQTAQVAPRPTEDAEDVMVYPKLLASKENWFLFFDVGTTKSRAAMKAWQG